MNTLSWNYWRLGNPRTVNALKKIVQVETPSLVFLMETKLPQKAKNRMSNIKNSLGFTQGLVVPSEGKSGGLALLWKPDVKMDV